MEGYFIPNYTWLKNKRCDEPYGVPTLEYVAVFTLALELERSLRLTLFE